MPDTPLDSQQTNFIAQTVKPAVINEDDKPIDFNDLVFKTMPKGFKTPKDYDKPKSVGPLIKNTTVAANQNDYRSQSQFMPSTVVPGAVIPDSSASAAPQSSFDSSQPPKSLSINWKKIAIIFVTALVVISVIIIAAHFLLSSRNIKEPTVSTVTNSNQNNPDISNTVPAVTSQLNSDWLNKYFAQDLDSNGNCASDKQSICGDNADPDNDGLTNLQEQQLGTDPTNPDTDGDGLADGDEVNVFNTDPLNSHTGGNALYTDSADVQYKYNSHTQQKYTDADLVQVAANIAKYSLHAPTTTTLDSSLISFFTAYESQTNSTTSGTPDALNRDTERLTAIKLIGYAILKYQQQIGSYPDTTSYDEMISDIKPMLSGIAVNTIDPTNVAPYVYTYASVNSGADFNLGYYSETQNKAITYHAADVTKFQAGDISSQRDTQRLSDLQMISQALDLYSNDHANPSNPTQSVYPMQSTWKQELSPKYVTTIPQDPLTKQDYVYTVSQDNATYGLQAQLENSVGGKSKYLCTSDGCNYY
jgi:hypothetical protein